MSSSDILLVVRWLVPLWLLGWAVLPVSRRLFSFLPDEGLAVGRVLALALSALLAFWLASVHLLPVAVGSLLVFALPLFCATQWNFAEARALWKRAKGPLIVSDCVFVLAFLFFVWVRLRHPSINDLEKPMDLALLAQSARTEMLPFEHFWFSGADFSNYYYFGPFMGGVLARIFGAPAPTAYNLVQPLFCALFLSVLWSLGAALSRSKWLGIGVMGLVGLGGHLEPLRQLRKGVALSEISWWDTSRVIPNTINEYPAFTMLIGDAHAHFYALSLAMAHFCICLGIVRMEASRPKAVLIALGGVMLGIVALTNTWDVPLYGLLWWMCVLYGSRRDADKKLIQYSACGGLALIVLVALPFFLRFRSQIGGGGFQLWIPNPFAFLLFWGVWIALAVATFGAKWGKAASSREGVFRNYLLYIGIVAVLFPSFYFLGGVFSGGELRHQDTVFKFYLQGWLLAGTAIASEFLLRLRVWTRSGGKAVSVPAWAGVAALAGVLSIAPYATWKTRTQGYGEPGLSLDGGQWLPPSDHQAIEWLRDQSGVVIERLGENNGGDYDANSGAIATQSGLPSFLCWPQHVRGWGFQNKATQNAMKEVPFGEDVKQAQANSVGAQMDERTADLNAIFNGNTSPDTRRALVRRNGISFIVIRPGQPPIDSSGFETHEFNGSDGSKTLILERKGF